MPTRSVQVAIHCEVQRRPSIPVRGGKVCSVSYKQSDGLRIAILGGEMEKRPLQLLVSVINVAANIKITPNVLNS